MYQVERGKGKNWDNYNNIINKIFFEMAIFLMQARSLQADIRKCLCVIFSEKGAVKGSKWNNQTV